MKEQANEDLSQVLETVRQITKTYSHSVPKPEDIAAIAAAYARLYPDLPTAERMAKAYEAYAAPGGEAAQAAFPVPSPEEIARVQEASVRLIPLEELQSISQVEAQASPEATALLRAVVDTLNASAPSASQRMNQSAVDALLALQQTLEGKNSTAQAEWNSASTAEQRPKSVWKTVYIVLGILIALGLILTLTVPAFRESLQRLF